MVEIPICASTLSCDEYIQLMSPKYDETLLLDFTVNYNPPILNNCTKLYLRTNYLKFIKSWKYIPK